MGFRVAREISETFSEQHCSKDSLFSFSSARCHLKMHPGLKITDFVFANLDRDFFFLSWCGIITSLLFLFFTEDIFKMPLKNKILLQQGRDYHTLIWYAHSEWFYCFSKQFKISVFRTHFRNYHQRILVLLMKDRWYTFLQLIRLLDLFCTHTGNLLEILASYTATCKLLGRWSRWGSCFVPWNYQDSVCQWAS